MNVNTDSSVTVYMLAAAVCVPPFLPPNCHIISNESVLVQGAEVTFVCQSTFQFGQQSLSKEDNVTAICNEEGNWEFVSEHDNCVDQSGAIINYCFTLESISYTPI